MAKSHERLLCAVLHRFQTVCTLHFPALSAFSTIFLYPSSSTASYLTRVVFTRSRTLRPPFILSIIIQSVHFIILNKQSRRSTLLSFSFLRLYLVRFIVSQSSILIMSLQRRSESDGSDWVPSDQEQGRAARISETSPSTTPKIPRREVWQNKFEAMTQASLRKETCCKSLKCFKHVNYDFSCQRCRGSTRPTRRQDEIY